jgi:16S rRNA (cytosine967-C5)-methyltransferase
MTSSIPHAHVRFRQASELLAQILPLTSPADQVIERYFKANKQMGSKDRAFAAETVYGCLRVQRELRAAMRDFSIADTKLADWLAAAWLLTRGGWSARVLKDTSFKGDAEALVTALRTADRTQWSFAERANLQDDHAQRLLQQFGETETLALAQALNQPASVDMRVNTLKCTRDQCKNLLAAENYECELTSYSPLGLRRAQRGPLFNTRAFRDGWFELQDEGSQLIGLLVQARPKQTVVDYCAGAGGKTLLLAAQMHNRGSLVACDTAAWRLDKLKPRLKRAGADNVRVQMLDDSIQALAGKADAVLVDAPCSGSGTWRRNPDMKWREMDLTALASQQLEILKSAATLVKPGGRLVYATCSIFDIENVEVVQAFLAQQREFECVPAAPILTREGVANAEGLCNAQGMMQCLPQRHGTDGFFAAVMQRTNK